MFSIVQMYTQASSVVLTNNDMSFQFPYKRGIRQGYILLSPILFSLDLDTHMTLKNCGGVQVNNIVLRSLIFADDLVLFSDSSEGLKCSLIAFESYWNIKQILPKQKFLSFRIQGNQLNSK